MADTHDFDNNDMDDAVAAGLGTALAGTQLGGWFLYILSLFCALALGLLLGYGDLLFGEFICYLFVSVVLLFVSLGLQLKVSDRTRVTLALIVVCLFASGLIVGVVSARKETSDTYDKAISYMQKGDYAKAKERFEYLDGYKDSAEKAVECACYMEYEQALFMKDSDWYWDETAYQRMFDLRGFAPADETLATPEWQAMREKALAVGQWVYFGRYHYGENSDNNRIRWVILARDGDKALLISNSALEKKSFHSTYEAIAWEACTLREWLNDTFFNIAFSAEEQAVIKTTTLDNGSAPATQDRVFLLSWDELQTYMPNVPKVERCDWWLRSTEKPANEAPCFEEWGLRKKGTRPVDEMLEVRPAIWVTLDPAFF